MTLKEAEEILRASGVEDARYDALTIAEYASGKSRAALIADRSCDLGEPFGALIARRAAREPLQYIVGEWGFMDAVIEVSPDCLIPRADTELLASLAAGEMKKTPGGALLDLCTGSGCVGIAVMMACPGVRCDAVELSEAAAAIAVRNAERNGVAERMNVIIGDVRDGADGGRAYAVITANPPYITAGEMDSLAPELAFEPEMALTDGGDGLSLIRAIIGNYKHKAPVIFIEIGASQGDAVTRLAHGCGCSCIIRRDLSGRDRVAEVREGD